MAKRAVSLNIVIDASNAEMRNEHALRVLCIRRMQDILSGNSMDEIMTTFQEKVMIEQFDENEEYESEEDEVANDFLINKDYGL
jgi:hypothetical protein